MDTTKLLLEMAADLLTRLDPVTVEPAPMHDSGFAHTQPAWFQMPLDLELSDE